MKLTIEKQICESFGIKLAYLFGSAARGDAHNKDVDVAVLLDMRAPNPVMEMDITEKLEKHLAKSQKDGPHPHISSLNSANALFRFEAIKEGRVLYAASEEERIDFEMRVIREYGDYKAKSRFYETALRERLRDRSA